jgi:alpha-tubulin suppressor-like RCC1 family protein
LINIKNIIQISAGGNFVSGGHSLILDKSGNVYSFGLNSVINYLNIKVWATWS